MKIPGTPTAAAAVLPVALPVAVWGLLGQDDYQGVPPSRLDYFVRPPELPPGLDTELGVLALTAVVASAVALARATCHHAFDRRWWQVLAPLLAAGLLVGWGWRVLTAGTIGANIGAGVVLMAFGPVVAALVLSAAGRGIWLARHPR
ncbi:hypothetical protein AB0G35_04345 [Streptomyces sp. NPDC021749]|uniref:hypothetical protein n=1 Tax=Streptomyces sp. NPDC021749 TaxID=3154905 RepID=UPI0033E20A3F